MRKVTGLTVALRPYSSKDTLWPWTRVVICDSESFFRLVTLLGTRSSDVSESWSSHSHSHCHVSIIPKTGSQRWPGVEKLRIWKNKLRFFFDFKKMFFMIFFVVFKVWIMQPRSPWKWDTNCYCFVLSLFSINNTYEWMNDLFQTTYYNKVHRN